MQYMIQCCTDGLTARFGMTACERNLDHDKYSSMDVTTHCPTRNVLQKASKPWNKPVNIGPLKWDHDQGHRADRCLVTDDKFGASVGEIREGIFVIDRKSAVLFNTCSVIKCLEYFQNK